MKITKRQLKKIIAEEKQKIVNESIADMRQIETQISDAAFRVSDTFADLMSGLKSEMGPGQISPTWEDEVDFAASILENEIKDAIDRAVQKIEAQLHDGAFYRG